MLSLLLRKLFFRVRVKRMNETLTTKEAAERLGVTPARVRQMVLSNQLPAEKFGRDLVIKASDLELVADRPIGRPPKSTDTEKRATGKKNARNGTSTGKKQGSQR